MALSQTSELRLQSRETDSLIFEGPVGCTGSLTVLGLETTHCNKDIAIHIAIHNSDAHGVLPMTYSAVRALLCR